MARNIPFVAFVYLLLVLGAATLHHMLWLT